MSSAVLQLILLQLKPDSKLEEVGSPAGDALLDVISVVKKADSQNRAYFGHQLENPDIGVLAFVYPTEEAAQAFSPSSEPKLGSFSTSVTTRTVKLSPAEGFDKAFGAPTTEIGTAFGIEEGFEKNQLEFSAGMAKALTGKQDVGFHACVVGTTVSDISKEEGGEKAQGAMFVLGWDSQEKHMAARNIDAVMDAIALIRVLNKGIEMWHVSFKEY